MQNRLLNISKNRAINKGFWDIFEYKIMPKAQKVYSEHSLILAIILTYSVIVMAIVYCKGKFFNFTWSWYTLNTLALSFYPIFFLGLLFRRLIRLILAGSGELGDIVDEIFSSYINLERLAGVIIIYLSIPIFIISFRNYKQTMDLISPFWGDRLFMQIDYYLHFGHHPWTLIQAVLGYPLITSILDKAYMIWFLEMFFIIFWMSWSSRRFLRAQFFVCFVLLWIFLGTIMATFLSSAGPCYYGTVIGLPDPYTSLLAYLHKVNLTHPLKALQNQQVLWDAYEKKLFLPFGGISAMPSMHVAGAVLFAILGWNVNKWLGLLLSAFAMVILIASVALAWHYAIDGYFSALGTLLLWRASGWVLKYIGWTSA
jgi:hypothetical protein